jgi:hypothetical protein
MTKKGLLRLQSEFMGHLLDKEGVSVLTPPERIFNEAKRLSIYRNNQTMGLTRALGDTYRVCYKLVGRRSFELLARHYIRDNPSYSTNLNDYGALFPEFILNFEPAKVLNYLSDVAKLEWLSHEVIIGQDEVDFCWQDLSTIPPHQQGDICFYRSLVSRLQYSPYPVDRIFEVNQADYVEVDNSSIVQLDDPVYLYIGREGYDLKIQRLDELEWKILESLSKDLTLSRLANLQIVGENKIDLAVMLPALIQRGLIAGFSFP